MFNTIKSIFKNKIINNNKLLKELDQSKILDGKILGELNLANKKSNILKNIQEAEFKVFSQWGDDGIINFLINYIDISNQTFVEFGVENYTECNTRFLLINNNWKGLIIDGSESNIQSIKNDEVYWKYDLTALHAFVTKENINQLLKNNNVTGKIGLLHIDIDGNDYWIWKEINVINPIIVIVEYNSVFGCSTTWTIPYEAEFERTKKHFSNLYFGCSIPALCDLANSKGYSFIGCNSNGNNAYFIRNDKLKDIEIKTAEEGFVESKFSESRNEAGSFTYIKGKQRLDVLKGLSVFNTRTKNIEII